MGRRSRKRGESTRAERDAARRERALAEASGRPAAPKPRPGRPSPSDRPRAPWGAFSGGDGQETLLAGLVIASLGGGELALREHLGGYRSHSSLLAGVAAFVAVTAVALGLGPVKIWTLIVVGIAVFAGTFYAMREIFKRRSGGLGFR